MKQLLFLWIVLLLNIVGLQAQTVISGKVTDTKNKPIAGASIAIVDSYDGGITDSLGNYRFVTIEKGAKKLEVSALNFKPFSAIITINKDTVVQNAELKELITELNMVTITAGAFEASDKKQGTVLTNIDIVTTPNAEGEVTGAFKTLPGTQQVGESEGLFVRGGTAAETKIFADGNLVNNFFYSSTPGIASRGRFNPFLFKGTVFSTGGYSALYGQALSSALILESNDMPDKNEADVNISVVGLGGGLQRLAKNKKFSWGAYYNYSNLSLAFALNKQLQQYYKIPQAHDGDLNFRIKTKRGIIKYYGYFSRSSVGFRTNDIDSATLQNAFELTNFNTYQNLHWKESLPHNFKIQAGVSFSVNQDDIQNNLQQNKTDIQFSQPALTAYNYKTYGVNTKSYYAQARTILEKKWKGFNATRLGAEFFYSNEAATYKSYQNTESRATIVEKMPVVFTETDFYITTALAVKAGVRAEHSQYLQKWNVAPRLSFAYKLAPGNQLSVAYGIFYQNPERRLLPAVSPNSLGFSKATHYILQYEYNRNKRIVRVEGYYKKYNNLYKTTNANGATAAFNNLGNGYAKGFEFLLRDKKTFTGVDYWISYSYLDTKRKYLNYPTSLEPSFATPHTASLVIKKFFTKYKTGFNTSYTFATGRPYYQILYNNNTQQNYINQSGKTANYNLLGLSLNYLPAVGKKNSKVFSVFVINISNVLGSPNVFTYNFGTIHPQNKVAVKPPSKRFIFIGVFLNIGTDRTDDAINRNL